MNYRHAYHAGNFADVTKHLALVAILLHLQKKESPFAVIDTHAGRGLYDLSSTESARTHEAANGISRLPASMSDPLIQHYLDAARRHGPTFYPGSPLITAGLLRPQDRLIAIEKHPEEAQALIQHLAPYKTAAAQNADGYTSLTRLLPPPQRRGLILIDPPFEAKDEFQTLALAVGQSLRRFAHGIYLIWFPIKNKQDASALSGELIARGAQRLLLLDFDINPAEPEKLHRSGLLIINPPYGVDDQIRSAFSALTPILGQSAPTSAVTWIAGSP